MVDEITEYWKRDGKTMQTQWANTGGRITNLQGKESE
jgi:hypothetical protein